MLFSTKFQQQWPLLIDCTGLLALGVARTRHTPSPRGATAQISLSLISISEARLARTRFETDQVSPVTAPAVGSVVLGSRVRHRWHSIIENFFFFPERENGLSCETGAGSPTVDWEAVSFRASTLALLITSGGSLRWWNWAASPLLCGPALESAAPSAASDDGCLMAASVHRTHLSSHHAGLAFASNAAEPGPM